MTENIRKFSKKTDWIIIGAVLFTLTIVFLLMQNKPSQNVAAHITADGETVAVIALDTAKDEILSFEEIPSAQFEIQAHRIRFINADCPDKVCERTGWLSRTGESAVCLPNRIAVTIEGGEQSIDTIVG